MLHGNKMRNLLSLASLAILAVAAALIWIAVFFQPDGRLHVVFLDIGEGDAILIKTPLGQNILIDGGASPDLLAAELGRELPFWQRTIDAIISTHPHEDHLAGLMAVMDRYDVQMALSSPITSTTPGFVKWEQLLAELPEGKVKALDRGDSLDLGLGVRISVLHPPAAPLAGTQSDLNNNSLVLKLTWGSTSFLLPGDIQDEGEQELLASGADLQSVVLKVPHQGAANALDSGFLAKVSPQIAVISVGAGNSFGHPAPAILQKLSGLEVYRTDINGTVRITSDGQKCWAETER